MARRRENPATVPAAVALSKAQIKVMQLLADGLPHHGIKEIKPLLPDGELGGRGAVANMIFRIREKLKGSGYTVICELYQSRIHYRYVKLVFAEPAGAGK